MRILLTILLATSSAFAQSVQIGGGVTIGGGIAGASYQSQPSGTAPYCWAAYGGNDSATGKDEGHALASVMSCYDQLLSYGVGGGTIYMMDGGVGGSKPLPICKSGDPAGCGFWIMGAADPNYSSPPSGWRKALKRVSFVGVNGSCNTAFSVSTQVCLSGGGSDATHPEMWLSDVYSHSFSNILMNSAAMPAYVGVGSDLGQSDSGIASWDNRFDNVGFITKGTVAGIGPALTVASTSGWNFLNFCQFQGGKSYEEADVSCNRASGTVTCTGVAHLPDGSVVLPSSWSGAMNLGIYGLTDPTMNGVQSATITSTTQFTFTQTGFPDSGSPATGGLASSDQAMGIWLTGAGTGTGYIQIVNPFFTGDGIRLYGAHSGIQVFNPLEENSSSPAVSIESCGNASVVTNANVADAVVPGIPSVEVDISPGAICAAKTLTYVLNSSVQGPVVAAGSSSVLSYPSSTAFPNPFAMGMTGIMGGQFFGQTNDSRRQAGLVVTRYTNLAATSPTSWSISGCVAPLATGVADPFGETGAGTYSGGSGTQIACWYRQSTTLAVGDWIVGGVWTKSVNGNSYASNTALEISAGGTTIKFSNGSSLVKNVTSVGGNGQWEWTPLITQVTVGGTGTVFFGGTFSDTNPTTYAYPVFNIIPVSGNPNANEVYAYAMALQSYRSDSVVGQSSLLPGVQFKADSLQIGSATAQGTCNSAARGFVTTVYSSAGVKDTSAVCLKDASDVYAWRTIY